MESAPVILVRPHQHGFGEGSITIHNVDTAGVETEIENLTETRGSRFPDVSEVVDLVTRQGSNSFIIDLAKVRVLNSWGLAWLVSAWSAITKAGGEPVLVNVNSKQIREAFRITKLENIFVSKDTVAQALAHLAKLNCRI